jgi:hypothetical protein
VPISFPLDLVLGVECFDRYSLHLHYGCTMAIWVVKFSKMGCNISNNMLKIFLLFEIFWLDVCLALLTHCEHGNSYYLVFMQHCVLRYYEKKAF